MSSISFCHKVKPSSRKIWEIPIPLTPENLVRWCWLLKLQMEANIFLVICLLSPSLPCPSDSIFFFTHSEAIFCGFMFNHLLLTSRQYLFMPVKISTTVFVGLCMDYIRRMRGKFTRGNKMLQIKLIHWN